MITEIERQSVDINRLPQDANLAIDLWQERGALDDAGKLTDEVCELIDEVGATAGSWDQDHRDAAVGLIEPLAARPEMLPLLDAEQQSTIARKYIEAVGNLQPQDDWLGAPWTMLELGKNVGSMLGKEIDFVQGMRLRGELAEAWSNYVAEVKFDGGLAPSLEPTLFRQSFHDELRKVQNNFLSRSHDTIIGETQRNGPNLSPHPASYQMALWYGQATAQGQSAQLDILRATPKYLESLKDRGVDIANFWNLTDIKIGQQAIDEMLTNPLVNAQFKDKFVAKIGADYEELSENEKQALTDLSLNMMREIYADMYSRKVPFDAVKMRILGQVEQAEAMKHYSKKLKPILKWVRQVEPEFDSQDPSTIQAFIEANEHQFRALHDQKNNPLDLALEKISSFLPPTPSHVRLAERTIFDLRSANLTADCTAWNLDAGFNAWTVPVWMTNPMFNFAYAYSGNTMVAKFGLILALDGQNGTQVIIDSIETNKNITSDVEGVALESIYGALSELQEWADRLGYGTLQICTYTNSEELTANLPICKDENEESLSGLNYEGLIASNELLSSINSELETPEIYLQSAPYAYDEFGNVITIENPADYTEGVGEFEKLAEAALAKTRKHEGMTEQTLLARLRSGDPDEILTGLIGALVPDFYEAVEFEYDSLKELYNNCVEDSGGHDHLEGSLAAILGSLLDEYRGLAEDEYTTSEEDWSLYDDEEFAQDRLDEAIAERVYAEAQKARPPLSESEKPKQQPPSRELVPSGIFVIDQARLVKFIETINNRRPKYEHLLDVLEFLFGNEFNQPINIQKAARYVFGVETEDTNEAATKETTIPLLSLPLYDRRQAANYTDS